MVTIHYLLAHIGLGWFTIIRVFLRHRPPAQNNIIPIDKPAVVLRKSIALQQEKHLHVESC